MSEKIMTSVEHRVAISYREVRESLSLDSGGIENRQKLFSSVCPSSSAEYATGVLGYRSPGSQTVIFLPVAMPFAKVLREIAEDVEIESRIRMVGACVQAACPHWYGKCALGHAVAKVADVTEKASECSIGYTCRWRKENGVKVCGPCRGVLNIPMKEAVNG